MIFFWSGGPKTFLYKSLQITPTPLGDDTHSAYESK